MTTSTQAITEARQSQQRTSLGRRGFQARDRNRVAVGHGHALAVNGLVRFHRRYGRLERHCS
jgi:hypothetical protein